MTNVVPFRPPRLPVTSPSGTPLRMDQETIMARARWMLGFTSRNTPDVQLYQDIFSEVQVSLQRAADPAEVLANAVWYFTWRGKFPTQKTLIEQEEYCFERLNRHVNSTKAQHYHVWKAIDMFYAHRQGVYKNTPEFAAFFTHKDLDRTAEKAFFQLDYVAQQRHHYNLITCIIDNMLCVDPVKYDMLLEALGKAVWERYKLSCSKATAVDSIKANNTVWKIRNDHPWMGKSDYINYALDAFRNLGI